MNIIERYGSFFGCLIGSIIVFAMSNNFGAALIGFGCGMLVAIFMKLVRSENRLDEQKSPAYKEEKKDKYD